MFLVINCSMVQHAYRITSKSNLMCRTKCDFLRRATWSSGLETLGFSSHIVRYVYDYSTELLVKRQYFRRIHN